MTVVRRNALRLLRPTKNWALLELARIAQMRSLFDDHSASCTVITAEPCVRGGVLECAPICFDSAGWKRLEYCPHA